MPQHPPDNADSDSATSSSGDTDNASIEKPTLLDYLLALFRLFYAPKLALEVLFSDSWPGLLFTLLLFFGLLPAAADALLPFTPPPISVFLFLQSYIEISPGEFVTTYYWFSSLAILSAVLLIGTLQKLLLRIPRESILFADSVASLAYALFPAFVLQLFSVGVRSLTVFIPTPSVAVSADTGMHTNSLFLIFLICLTLVYGAYLWWQAISLLTKLSRSQKTLLAALLVIIGAIPLVGTALAISYRQSGASVAPRSMDYISDSLKLKHGDDSR